MTKFKLILVIAFFAICSLPAVAIDMAVGKTYYVNVLTGCDKNSGNIDEPFASIAAINRLKLSGGETIYFAANQYFPGNLVLTDIKSSSSNPLTIASYGTGRAMIDAGAGTGILIQNCTHVIVSEVNLVGLGRKSGNKGSGIDVQNSSFVSISGVEASGFLQNGIGSYGGNDIKITNCIIRHNGSNGIGVSGPWEPRETKNIYISRCIADNNPGNPFNLNNHSGNGILVGHATNVLIEYCEAMNNGYDMPRDGNGPVGIWGYECDSLIIRYCYSHDNKTSEKGKDGGGFDFDGGITNSIMEYNISANNEGAGYGLFQFGGANKWSDNIIRYNVSINDGSKNSKAGIFVWCDPYNKDLPLEDSKVYGNVCFGYQGSSLTFETGYSNGMLFRDNTFILRGEKHINGDFFPEGLILEGNRFWSETAAMENKSQPLVKEDSKAIYTNPPVTVPEFISIGNIKEIVHSIVGGIKQPLCVYNNWSAYDELSDNIPLSEELSMKQLREVLRLRKHGADFDYYLMDAFWFDLESGYRSWRKEYWPNGPAAWIEACRQNNLKPGLWFSTNLLRIGGPATSLKAIPEWKESVSDDGTTLCLFRGGYLDHLMETLQIYADMGIRLFKFDFAYFDAAIAPDKLIFTKEEIEEKNKTAFIDALKAFRTKNPEVMIIAFNGFGGDMEDTLMPFRRTVDHRWLEVFDTMYSGDPRVSDVPMMNFWRSADLYSDHMVRQYLYNELPIERIDNCAFMIGTTGTCYNRALQAWKGMFVLMMARGGWLNVYHGNLDLLSDSDAGWFGKAQQFYLNVQRNAETSPFGAIPGYARPYGWKSVFPTAGFSAVYTLVNPSQETSEIELPDARGTGRILFTDNGFKPVLKDNKITLGSEQMVVVGYGRFNDTAYDLGIEKDILIPSDIDKIDRYDLSFPEEHTAFIKITPDKRKNIRILLRQCDESGRPFRSWGGAPSDGAYMTEFFEIQASAKGNSIPLRLEYDKQIWCGLSWAVAEIPHEHFKENEAIEMTVSLRDGLAKHADLSLYYVSY